MNQLRSAPRLKPRPAPHQAARERLLRLQPYAHGPAADKVFWNAMEEALSWHLGHNAAFRRLADQSSVWQAGTLDCIPFVHVNVFKTRVLLSVAPDDIVLNLTSSGTTGQISQNLLDATSERWHVSMLKALEADQGLVGSEPADLLWLMHHPDENPAVAAVYSCQKLAGLAPVGERFYAVQDGVFRQEETRAWLAARSGRNRRLRVVGACPFLLRLLASQVVPFAFHPDSYVLTGGGWKTAQSEAVDREVFIERISQRLGVLQQNLRDHFGMVEHAVPYPECSYHRHHVPTYARVLIRHPGTLEVLPSGMAGLLQVLTPMVHSVPAISIITTDWASLDPSPCPCGRSTPALTLLGRAGINKNRGCALTAAALLEASHAHA